LSLDGLSPGKVYGMNRKDPKVVALQFNEYINNRDIDGIAKIIADDYEFIDSSGDIFAGKEREIQGWKTFFDRFPDYRNHFSIVESRENLVLIIGHSTCSYENLDGPALWTARIENDLVAEWRVYLDTPENRGKLNLPDRFLQKNRT
jgi:ketosteroid isomerase-like protein